MVESEEDEKSPDKVDDVLNMYQASKFKLEPQEIGWIKWAKGWWPM